MFFTTLSNEQFNTIIKYLSPNQIEKYNSTAEELKIIIKKIIDNIPPLPEPQKMPDGSINKNIETNGQIYEYLPIILLLGSPTLTSKLLDKEKSNITILKSLPKIIIKYLVPTSIDALYFIDPYLLKLFNDAKLIDDISLTNNPVQNNIITDSPFNNKKNKPKIKNYDQSEIQKLTTPEILRMNNVQTASILVYLSPSQILSLDIIPKSPNINNIINNININSIDFTNYKYYELLFLTESQVQKLTINQLKTIESILPKFSGIITIINKLSSQQLHHLIKSDNHLFPLNRLSIDQLKSLPKSYFSNMPNELQPSIISLTPDKYNIISKNFNISQIKLYDDYFKKVTNILTNTITNTIKAEKISDNDSLLIYVLLILSSPNVGSKLLEQNIDVIGFLKKLPNKTQSNLLLNTSIESLILIDPYTLNLYYEADLIIPIHIPDE
jgi:hypothetical protein